MLLILLIPFSVSGSDADVAEWIDIKPEPQWVLPYQPVWRYMPGYFKTLVSN